MARRRPCSLALAALVALSLSLGSGVVMAHPTTYLLDTHAGAAQTVGHLEPVGLTPSTRALVWAVPWLVAGIVLLRLAARRSRRQVIALGLTLAVGVFALESAVHSVHHLADPETAATCPVLSGSQHLGWGETPKTAYDAPPPRVAPAPALRADAAKPSLIRRPHQERAPPA
jgi:hypothetical protein